MKYKCTYDLCSFEDSRKENFRRHVEEVHQKIKQACECGKEMTRGALSRHKQFHCPLRKQIKCKSTEVASKITTELSCSPVVDNVADVKEYTIHTTVKILTLKDGTVMLLQNDIRIDDFVFNVSAEFLPDGKKFCFTLSNAVKIMAFLFSNFAENSNVAVHNALVDDNTKPPDQMPVSPEIVGENVLVPTLPAHVDERLISSETIGENVLNCTVSALPENDDQMISTENIDANILVSTPLEMYTTFEEVVEFDAEPEC